MATLALLLAFITLPISLVGFIGAVAVFPAGVTLVLGFVAWRVARIRGGVGRRRAIAAIALGTLGGVLAALQLAYAPGADDPAESPTRHVALEEGRREMVAEVNSLAREVARGFPHRAGAIRQEPCRDSGDVQTWSVNYHVTISLSKKSDARLLARRMAQALQERGYEVAERRGFHVGTLDDPISYGIDADLERKKAYLAGSVLCVPR